MSRESNGVISLMFGDLEMSDWSQLLINSCRDWISPTGEIVFNLLISATAEIILFASGTDGSGSGKIFLLLNYSSHDPQFFYTSRYRNFPVIRKKIKFLSSRVLQIFDTEHGSHENYSDFFFVFCFSSSQMRAMRSPSYNSSKILSNRNEFLQTCRWVNIIVQDTFWAISDQWFWR